MSLRLTPEAEALMLQGDPWISEGRRLSFSHSGEDILLGIIFREVDRGFYVDFGCFDPVINSNTYALHRKGWQGLNLDANPNSIGKFNEARPADINCNFAIAEVAGEVDLYLFSPEAPSNSTSASFAEAISAGQSVPIAQTLKITALRTSDVIGRFLPRGVVVDFWNIDLESLDLVALTTNDWSTFRPRVIAVEDFDFVFGGAASPIHAALTEQGYVGFSRYQYTTFYVDPRAAAGLAQLPKIG